MKTGKISAFMLERYRLGELSPEDQNAVRENMALDEDLRSRLESLDKSDRELRIRYPAEFFNLKSPESRKMRFAGSKARIRPALLARIAALVLICILLPVIYFVRNGPGSGLIDRNNSAAYTDASGVGGYSGDRVKGLAVTGSELALYLKGDGENTLPNQAILREGNTVQLAYTAPAGEHYGVIFSIDGRSVVTMHYPYRAGQSSLLVSGKRTFLDESYTLDDAPDYEIFVFVVSGKALDPEAVLKEAQKMAGVSDLRSIEEKSREAFKDCEVETVTVLKASKGK